MLRQLSRTVAILTVTALAVTSVPGADARTLPPGQRQSTVDLWVEAASAWLVSLLPGAGFESSGRRLQLDQMGRVGPPKKATRRSGRLLRPVCNQGIDPLGRCT
jgi:hypothetical protein